MRQITEIIIHCSATPEGRNIGAATIRHWHLDRGFQDIGYHYVVRLNGTVETGRPVEQIGAHCTNHNRNSIGICYIGGLDRQGKPKDTRTPEQKHALAELCRQLLLQFPGTTIHGHNEFANKACPCFDVQQWRKEVKL